MYPALARGGNRLGKRSGPALGKLVWEDRGVHIPGTGVVGPQGLEPWTKGL